jgi:hypothetical protein
VEQLQAGVEQLEAGSSLFLKDTNTKEKPAPDLVKGIKGNSSDGQL